LKRLSSATISFALPALTAWPHSNADVGVTSADETP
jgi:hypothetical protein